MNKNRLGLLFAFSSLLFLTISCSNGVHDAEYRMQYELVFQVVTVNGGQGTTALYVINASMMDQFDSDYEFYCYATCTEPKHYDVSPITGITLKVDGTVFHVNNYKDILFDHRNGFDAKGKRDDRNVKIINNEKISRPGEGNLIYMRVRFNCGLKFT